MAGPDEVYCSTCNVWLRTWQYDDHLRGRKHRKELRGEPIRQMMRMRLLRMCFDAMREGRWQRAEIADEQDAGEGIAMGPARVPWDPYAGSVGPVRVPCDTYKIRARFGRKAQVPWGLYDFLGTRTGSVGPVRVPRNLSGLTMGYLPRCKDVLRAFVCPSLVQPSGRLTGPYLAQVIRLGHRPFFAHLSRRHWVPAGSLSAAGAAQPWGPWVPAGSLSAAGGAQPWGAAGSPSVAGMPQVMPKKPAKKRPAAAPLKKRPAMATPDRRVRPPSRRTEEKPTRTERIFLKLKKKWARYPRCHNRN